MLEQIFSLPSLTPCTNSQSHNDCLHGYDQQYLNDKHCKATDELVEAVGNA